MDYKYLRAWGLTLGSSDWYVNEELAKAREDKAPEDVIYWQTAEQRRHSIIVGHYTEKDLNDPAQFFHADSGRIWSRWREETAPFSTRNAMATNLRRYTGE